MTSRAVRRSRSPQLAARPGGGAPRARRRTPRRRTGCAWAARGARPAAGRRPAGRPAGRRCRSGRPAEGTGRPAARLRAAAGRGSRRGRSRSGRSGASGPSWRSRARGRGPTGRRSAGSRSAGGAPGCHRDTRVSAAGSPLRTARCSSRACLRSWSRSGSWGSEAVAIAASFRCCRPVRDAGRKEGLNSDAVALPSMGGLSPFRGPGGAPRAHPKNNRFSRPGRPSRRCANLTAAPHCVPGGRPSFW